MGMGSHHSARLTRDEWLTPPEIIEDLGPFDLDPCSPIERPWPTAKNHFTILDNGLSKEWTGRVWLNPPYGRKNPYIWLKRLAEHGDGIALIFARTETETFFKWVWERADAVLFIKGRLRFYEPSGSLPSGTSGAPSVLVAYGDENARALEVSGIDGITLFLSTDLLSNRAAATRLRW